MAIRPELRLITALALGLASTCGGTPGGGESDAALMAQIEATAVAVQGALAKAFADAGQTYRAATVRVVLGDVTTACGATQNLIGFYCATDQTVYVELAYYRDLRRRHGERGERAHAYLIAHELGHHAQELLGVDTSLGHLDRTDAKAAREASRQLELQADCHAGVWAHEARRAGFATSAEVAHTLDALADVDASAHATTASAPADGGRHGTAAQRRDAFLRGRAGGSLAACGGELGLP